MRRRRGDFNLSNTTGLLLKNIKKRGIKRGKRGTRTRKGGISLTGGKIRQKDKQPGPIRRM